jgi:hypothetical protein
MDDKIEAAIDAAIEHIQREEPFEYEFFFILAGYLRGVSPGSHNNDMRRAMELVPAAQEFGRRINASEVIPIQGIIDFGDSDASELEFLKAWGRREYAMGGNRFELAMKLAQMNPLELPAHTNKWVCLVVNLGFCLAEMQGRLPFLIPVNETTATLAGTSLRTWSLAVQEGIRSKFLTVREHAKLDGGPRKARRLVFNYQNPHVKAGLERYRKNFRLALDEG